jgi:MFS family permease
MHTAEHATVTENPPRRSWAVLAVALTAQILVVLDISVVNTALPTIGRSLRLGSGDLQWLVTAYLLLSGGGLLLGGRIADLLPRRRVFLTGLSIFTGASGSTSRSAPPLSSSRSPSFPRTRAPART